MKMYFLKSWYRSFIKFRIYGSINITGLSIGFICSITLLLYVGFQKSFDNFHDDKDRIFRIAEISTNPDAKETSPVTYMPAGPELKNSFPEIESYNRIVVSGNKNILFDDKEIKANTVLYTDKNFFSFFSFKLIEGSSENLLNENNGIVVTKKLADKLFKNNNALNKEIKLNNEIYFIKGIAEDPPLNSHIQFDMIIPLQSFLSSPDIYIGWDGGRKAITFIKLSKTSYLTDLTKKLHVFLEEKINKKDKKIGYYTEYLMEPVTSIHMNSKVDWDYKTFDRKYAKNVYILFYIGCLVLITALINYLFITCGINAYRIKEYKIKNCLGIGKTGLRKIVFSDSLINVLLSGIIALFAIYLFKPVIENIFKYDFISFQIRKYIPILLFSFVLISFFLFFILHISLQKNFRLINWSLQINHLTPKSKLNYITALQFIIAIVLISSLFVIQKQLKFALNKDLGFEKENIITIIYNNIGNKYDVILNEFRNIPGVNNVTASFGLPGMEHTSNGYTPEGSEKPIMFGALYVDDNFLETYKIKMVEGRTFNHGHNTDINSFLINESLAKKLNWENPLGKKIYRDNTYEVIGVVKDFHLSSIYHKIPPLIISKEYSEYFYALSIAVNSQDIQNTIKQMTNAWTKILPGNPFNFSFLEKKYEDLYSEINQTIKIISMFTGISVIISLLGLFGITLLSLSGKIKEIGIRKVNGAKITEIIALINKNIAIWITIAFIIAYPISWLIMKKWLEAFAYKTEMSWWIFVLSGLSVLFIAISTVCIQSWTLANRNPVEALRYE